MAGFTNTSLTTASGAIGADVAMPASTTTTVLTTASLSAGVWLVTMSALVNSATGGTSIELQGRLGTAAGSISGETSAQSVIGSAAGYATLSITFVATLTSSGTLTLVGNPNNAAVAHYNTNAQAWAGATGYTAVKIG